MPAEKLATNVRKDQIAKATLEVVAARGLSQLSVAAVARRVGVAPSALYRHFPSKADVLDAAVDMVLTRLLENVDAVRAEELRPLEHLRRLLDRHIRMIRESRGIPLIMLAQDFYFNRPDRRRRVHQGIEAYLARVADLIRQAQQIEQVDPQLDPHTVSVLFLGMIQPLAILWHMSDGDFDVTRQAQRAWPLFLRAIQTGATAPTDEAKTDRQGEQK